MATIWKYKKLFVGQRPFLMSIPHDPRWPVTQEMADEHDIIGFMTPEGTDAAAEKRKETLFEWCRKDMTFARGVLLDAARQHPSYVENKLMHRGQYIDGRYQIIENVPVTGFKFYGSVSRYSTSNKLVQLLDPRGFVLEISVANVLALMETSTIEKGTIVDPCVWGRESASNVLVNVNSDLFKTMKDKK